MIRVTNDWTDEIECYATRKEAIESFDLTEEEYDRDVTNGITFDFHLAEVDECVPFAGTEPAEWEGAKA